MKRYLYSLFFVVVACFSVFSQTTPPAPFKFNYQAVARDANGAFIDTKKIGVMISILENGNPVYSETHTTNTNKYGLFNLQIGGGTVVISGTSISSLNWGGTAKEIKIDIDPAGGNNYTTIGKAQLLSVPYALYSNTAGMVTSGGGGSTIEAVGGIVVKGSKIGVNVDGITIDTNRTTKKLEVISVSGTKITDSLALSKLEKDGATDNQVLTFTNGKWGAKDLPVGNGSTKYIEDGGIKVYGSKIGVKVDKKTLDTTGGVSGKELQIIAVPGNLIDSVSLDKLGKFNAKNGDVIKFNGGAWTLDQDQIGVAGGGITSINSYNEPTQTLTIDTNATDINLTSKLNVTTREHSINLPILGKATTTSKAGLLSKVDYEKFKLNTGNSTPLNVGRGFNLDKSSNKLTFKIGLSLDTSGGFLRVRRLDSLEIGSQKEGQILKVVNGKLKFANDSIGRGRVDSSRAVWDAGNIGNHPIDTTQILGTTQKGQVLTWTGTQWQAQANTSTATNCTTPGTVSPLSGTYCNGATFVLNPYTNMNSVATTGGSVLLQGVYNGVATNYTFTVSCQSATPASDASLYLKSGQTLPADFYNATFCIISPLLTGNQATYNAGEGIGIDAAKTISAKNKQALWNAGSIGYSLIDTAKTKVLSNNEKGNVLKWDGTKWTADTILRGSSTGTGWSLTGNTLTTAGKNYIGTNDAVGFKIKTDNVTKMTIDATGNVLFGKLYTDTLTANPRAAFEQRGKVGATAAIFGGEGKGISFVTGANVSGIGFNSYFGKSNLAINSGYGANITFNTQSGALVFQTTKVSAGSADDPTTPVDLMTLTQDGKLGISSLVPTHKLTVGNLPTDSNTVKFYGYGSGKSQLLYVDKDGVVRDTNFSTLSGSSNSWSLTGNTMSLNDSTPATGQFLGCTTNAPLIFKTNNTVRMQIGRSGNIGIGQLPTLGYALAVNGKIKTSNITESSDIRYKKNIQPITNALNKIVNLKGVSYNWRQSEFPHMNFEKGTDLGLIAQEVEKVLPELVNTDDQGYKSVEYSHLVSVLVEAIKEQQIQIESLKQEVMSKENKVQKNESRIQSLEASVNSMATQMQLLLELIGKNEGVKASK